MNKTPIIAYEMLRAVNSKKYIYILAGLCLFTCRQLYGSVSKGTSGTPPWSVLTFVDFLAALNTFLLPLLILLCIPVFDSKEHATRRILFSTPISSHTYFLMKAGSIAAVFAVTCGILISGSALFYALEFHFFNFTTFLVPILIFLVSPSILVLGLCFSLGRWTVKSLYLLLPIVWFMGMAMLQFPPWLDLTGDDYLHHFNRLTLIHSLRNVDPPTFMQPNLLWSRAAFLLIGTSLLIWSCRKIRD